MIISFCHNPRLWRTDRQTDRQKSDSNSSPYIYITLLDVRQKSTKKHSSCSRRQSGTVFMAYGVHVSIIQHQLDRRFKPPKSTQIRPCVVDVSLYTSVYYMYVYCDNKVCMCHVSYDRRLLHELAEVQRRYCLRNETRYVKQRRCDGDSIARQASYCCCCCCCAPIIYPVISWRYEIGHHRNVPNAADRHCEKVNYIDVLLPHQSSLSLHLRNNLYGA